MGIAFFLITKPFVSRTMAVWNVFSYGTLFTTSLLASALYTPGPSWLKGSVEWAMLAVLGIWVVAFVIILLFQHPLPRKLFKLIIKFVAGVVSRNHDEAVPKDQDQMAPDATKDLLKATGKKAAVEAKELAKPLEAETEHKQPESMNDGQHAGVEDSGMRATSTGKIPNRSDHAADGAILFFVPPLDTFYFMQ